MTLGEFVKRRRAVLGLTQPQVMARIPSRTTNWLSRIENDQAEGLPDHELLSALAAALECTEAELIAAAGYNINAPDQAEPWGWAPLTPEQERLVREIIDQFKRDGE